MATALNAINLQLINNICCRDCSWSPAFLSEHWMPRLAKKHDQLYNVVGITRCPHHRFYNGTFGYKSAGGVVLYPLLVARSADQAGALPCKCVLPVLALLVLAKCLKTSAFTLAGTLCACCMLVL